MRLPNKCVRSSCLFAVVCLLFLPYSATASNEICTQTQDKSYNTAASTDTRAGRHGAAARQLFPVFIPAAVMSDRRQRARVQGSWARQVPRPRGGGGGGGPAGKYNYTSNQHFTPFFSLTCLQSRLASQGARLLIISMPTVAWPPCLLCGSLEITGHQRPLSFSSLRRLATN